MSERHLLRTVSPPLRRGAGQVQFGTSAEHSLVVEGLTDDQIAALEQLDGTHELPEALGGATAGGLLALLHQHDLLVGPDEAGMLAPGVRALLATDARAQTLLGTTDGYAVLSSRRASPVLVCGRGALPTAVAALLRRSGVARVLVGEVAAADQTPDPAPALVVLTALDALDATLGVPWQRRGTPVLPVVLHGVEAVVGPMVTAGGPCLRCLDLTRTDLDPAWPLLLGQLLRPGVGPGADVDGETSLVALAAAMTAMVALAVLDGHEVPAGRSFEIGLPWPRVRQRHWQAHPRCGCGGPACGSGTRGIPNPSTRAGPGT